ncbi:DUF3488 and transglutaminase-like domain-containing protein [Homoserinimonas sp. OAct 916]|uniref:transglutaminase TgpA family protein n=1 Tax=Homoserinimonas sp. OAct 916 TaxID=2211450 RepID=UPI000DBE787F|nr:DUF3488 and transglutaminase-like domain-containing protein [Homoserinimonas sp. OAct 916]
MSSTEARRLPPVRSARRLPPARRASWPVTGAVWLCVVVSAAGLGPLLVGGRWWLVAAAVAAVIVVVTALVRATRLPDMVVAFSAPATYVLVMTWIFVPASTFFFVPTRDTVTTFGTLFQEGVKSIYRQTMPAAVEPGLLLILVAGVGLIAVVFDLVVFSVRAPAAAGILLVVVLAIPAVTQGSRVDGFVFIATAVSFLILLRADMLRRDSDGGARRRRTSRGATGADDRARVTTVGPTGAGAIGIGRQTVVIAAAALVGAMLLGAVLPGFDRPPPVPLAGNTTIFGGGINPIISLGKSLRKPSDAVMLTYTTTAKAPPYLSVITLDRFTGDNWAPTLRDPDPTRPVLNIGPIPGLGEQTPRGDDIVTDVTIENLVSRWLPLPYPSSSVRLAQADWFWEPSDLSVSGEQPTGPGLSYAATTVQPEPTVDQLNAAGDPVDNQQYRELPGDLPAIIRETANDVTEGASSHYEQAVMLQEYLRGSTFTYSLDAPVKQGYDGDGMAVLSQFLKVRSGYCVHFASAMAVMARSLGIPTRIAVGYQPGTPVSAVVTQPAPLVQRYEVSSADLHAWPQLYFEGIGWLNFEPTPTRGSPAAYSLPATGSNPGASAAPSIAPSPGASAAPNRGPSRAPLDVGEAPSAGADTTTGVGWAPTAVLLTLLLVLLLPAVTRIAVRAFRLRNTAVTGESAVRAWREVLATAADLAIPLPTTRTPRQVLRELSLAMAPDDEARQALARMVRAVEHAWFAPTGTELPEARAHDARIIIRALRKPLPASHRVRATLMPLSLLPSWIGPRTADDVAAGSSG